MVSTGQGILGNNMFIYCNNAPTIYSDGSGFVPTWANAHYFIDDEPLAGIKLIEYIELEKQLNASGITLYSSVDSAIAAWSSKYLPLSKEYEHVAFLYCIETSLGPRYCFSTTYRGSKGNFIMSPNVILGTLYLRFESNYVSRNLVAAVHTHPDPGVGYHNDFPSYESGIYGGDRIAYEMLHLPEMYIIPYKTCSGTPQVIVYSDMNTWCDYAPEYP